METARHCLMDTLGCGLLALTFDDCKKMLGPFADDVKVKNGVRVPGIVLFLIPLKVLGISGDYKVVRFQRYMASC